MSAIIDNLTRVRPQASPSIVWSTVRHDAQKFWAVIWGGSLLACLPFLIPYFRSLWRQDLYQYFPFVVLSVAYFAYIRSDHVLRGPRGKYSWVTLIGGVVVLMAAAVINSPWLGGVAFVLIASALLASLQSLNGRSLAYLALPLVMLIRMPQLHAESLIIRLQRVTTGLSSLALDVIGIPHDMYGNFIELPTKKLFVAEACSGIQSAFTMCFLALLIIVWRRRPLALTPIYLLAALVLAILANMLRVTAVAIAEAWYAVDMTSGWAHDLVGYSALAAAAAVLLSFDQLCSLVFYPVEVRAGKRGRNPFAVAWNGMLGFRTDSDDEVTGGYATSGVDEQETQSGLDGDTPSSADDGSTPRALGVNGWLPPAVVGAAALAAAVMIGGMLFGRTDRRPITAKDAVLFDPPKNFLQDRIGVLAIGNHEVVRNGSDPQLGLHADVWKCGAEGAEGHVVMSQPYVGWHELCVCYENRDWKLIDRRSVAVAQGKPMALGKFKNEDGTNGYLFFTAIDSDGSIPTPPSYTLFGRLLAPFGPLITDDYAEATGSAQTIMLQMWTVTDKEMSPKEIQRIADSMATIREDARRAIIEKNKEMLSVAALRETGNRG